MQEQTECVHQSVCSITVDDIRAWGKIFSKCCSSTLESSSACVCVGGGGCIYSAPGLGGGGGTLA